MRLALLIVASLGLCAAPLAAAQQLAFCHNEDGGHPWLVPENAALAPRIVKLLAQELGQPVRLVARPWGDCLRGVKSGSYQGALAAGHVADWLEYGQYPLDEAGQLDGRKRLFTERYVLVRPKGGAARWDGKTVQPHNALVATNRRFSIGDTLRQGGTLVDQSGNSAEAVLTKLMVQRADAAVVLDGAAAKMLAQPDYGARLEVLPAAVEERTHFLLLGHGVDGLLAARVWDALERVTGSPEYAALLAAFFAGR